MGRKAGLVAPWFVVAVVVALSGVRAQDAPPATAAPDLSGTWQAAGWNMGTERTAEPSYRMQVSLERKEKETYIVSWLNDGKPVNQGVGLYDARTGVFATGYTIKGRTTQSPGVAVFKISEDKRTMDCVGTFQAGVGNVAYEEWKRPQ